MYCCSYLFFYFFFFKQKTAYEMRISDWSSDVCSSDLLCAGPARPGRRVAAARRRRHAAAPRREGRAVERRLPPAEISVRSLARGPDYPALAGREVASRFGRAAGPRRRCDDRPLLGVAALSRQPRAPRPEGRRVGKEWARTCD